MHILNIIIIKVFGQIKVIQVYRHSGKSNNGNVINEFDLPIVPIVWPRFLARCLQKHIVCILCMLECDSTFNNAVNQLLT